MVFWSDHISDEETTNSAFTFSCVFVLVSFFLHLSRNVLASTQQQTAGNSVNNVWCDEEGQRKSQSSKVTQSSVGFSSSFLLFHLLLSDCYSSLSIKNTPLPISLLTGPAMCWINTKWQNSRACRRECVWLFVCVCTFLLMCECETWHITGIWVTLLSLSISCMQLICFDMWPSPIQTAYFRKTINKVPTLLNSYWCNVLYFCLHSPLVCFIFTSLVVYVYLPEDNSGSSSLGWCVLGWTTNNHT